VFGSLNFLNQCKSVNLLTSIPVELINAAQEAEEMKKAIRKEFENFTLQRMVEEEVWSGWKLMYQTEADWDVFFDGIQCYGKLVEDGFKVAYSCDLNTC